ncbi:FUSC family protein [Francisella sp. 19X1-34]|uniref:FUSC family protein n=1 Tax=Francisella sp. 19X1-34 TaxID=3087177 RepID=UPI002E36A4DC|nr:FUSC family protein [Francisella sp. 19X1-34]MED7787593.1 FUSC family protein [Francisella sp. 19X1-34]
MQFAFLNSNKYAAINAFKASIAVMLGYLIGYVLGDILEIHGMYLWIVITILVVMSTQPNLGGALDKAIMRFLGTLIGATVATVIVASISNDIIQVFLSIPFIFLAVYFAGASRYSYAGTLAGITLIIIILNRQPGEQVAIYRAVEISLGIIISLIVNRFILPIRAETRLKESFSKTISQIHDFFDILFIERNHSHKKLRESIFHEFTKHLTLVKELKYEKSAKKVREFEKMSLYIRRLYRYMIVMYEYIEASFDAKTIEKLDKEPAFIEFKKYIMQSLLDISNDIKARRRISYKELLRFEKHILPLLKDVEFLNDKDKSFTFNTNMFLNALKRLSLEYNYILQISKH